MIRRTLITIVSVTMSRTGLLSIWFVALVLIYRTLGKTPEGLAEAGFFAFSLATIRVFVSWIGDTVDLEVMRRVPQLLEIDRRRGFAAWRAASAVRLAAALLVTLALIVAAEPVSRIFMEGRIGWALWYCGIGTVAELMIRAELSFLQADETFRKFLKLEAFWQAIRFLSIAALMAAGSLNGHSAVAAYVGSSVVAALAGVMALPRDLIWPFTVTKADLVDVLDYVKWIVPAVGLAALGDRSDLFLVKYFEGAAAAGLFGAILSLALIPDAVSGFLATTLQPRVTRLYRDGEFMSFVAWFSRFALPLCAAAILATIVFGSWALTLLLGASYTPVATSFIIMTIGAVNWLALTPLPLALVALARPRLMLKITLVNAVAGIALRVVLISWYGILGAALAFLILRTVLAIYLVYVAYRIARDTVKPGMSTGKRGADVPFPSG